MYFVIDKGSAEWLLLKKQLIKDIVELMVNFQKDGSWKKGRFGFGPIRMLIDPISNQFLLVNIEGQDKTQQTGWGYIKLAMPFGVLGKRDIAPEVFERQLTIIKTRLSNYFIDGSYIHRSYANGAHTCIAGRGSAARQQNIGFIETKDRENDVESVLVIGPEYKYDKLVTQVGKLVDEIPQYRAETRKIWRDYSQYEDISTQHEILKFSESLLGALGFSSEKGDLEFEVRAEVQSDYNIYTYEEYIDGKLNPNQKRIVDSDVVYRSPLRILGPAGSGKTLLMQLLSIKVIRDAELAKKTVKCLYLVHNNELVTQVRERFLRLDPMIFRRKAQALEISTLYSYAVKNLEIDFLSMIDSDAFESKQFQYEELSESLAQTTRKYDEKVSQMNFFRRLDNNQRDRSSFIPIVMNEISSTIKGQGLIGNREKYVFSERPLSKLHGVLNQVDREFLFDSFEDYYNRMFNDYSVLDTDDIAVSLLGRLKTPLWEMRRKTAGFDFIFIDEAQLFNENERKILTLLGNKSQKDYIPVVIALDPAQDLFSQFNLAEIGISDLANESLDFVHRSSQEITDLAFFIIQKSTTLFTPDFPSFSRAARLAISPDVLLLEKPVCIINDQEKRDFSKFVIKQVINRQRKEGLKTIAVVCFGDAYWDELLVTANRLSFVFDVIETRGEKAGRTNVVLSRPQYVGGQEFDSVIIVGLEQGVYPPVLNENFQLQATLDEQCIRETYLAVSRARKRVTICLNNGSRPNQIIRDAIDTGRIVETKI